MSATPSPTAPTAPPLPKCQPGILSTRSLPVSTQIALISALVVKEETAVSEDEGAEDGPRGEEHENDDEEDEEEVSTIN